MTTTPEELSTMVVEYLKVRRALGYKLHHIEYIMQRYLAWLVEHDAAGITVENALAFATAPTGASPRWQALRLSAIRCFTKWARLLDPSIEVPPAKLLPARVIRAAPYIYTPEEIQALLAAADLLRPELRAATYRTFIGLMAATGIRTGEALGLDIASLDQQAHTLTVTGKYNKTRMLPLHPSVVEALTGYMRQRNRLLPAATCPALLISTRGTRMSPSNLHATFRGLAKQAGLRPASTACHPRPHDLRHTFAVTTMLDAYNSGADPAAVLPVLSTWLGHSEPRDTYWYLSGTSELLAAATKRLELAGSSLEGSRP